MEHKYKDMRFEVRKGGVKVFLASWDCEHESSVDLSWDEAIHHLRDVLRYIDDVMYEGDQK